MYLKCLLRIRKSTFIYNRIAGISVKSYTDTVILPKTNFPLRLAKDKLIERDKKINEVLNSNDLYIWQKENLSGPEFILHDGPPYANGTPHMGHAINKILKDVILRYKILDGRKVNYVPGWDCHGLPIELKTIQSEKEVNEPLEIRKRARKFANEAIIQQNEAFQSWGVLGDWNNAYKTFNVPYIKNQFQIFHNLYLKNLVFRDYKPIYWSPSTKTALAESELEYHENHVSDSLYVRFKVESIPQVDIQKPIFALIWTTTPWTLPSNQAVCFNPDLTYCLCTNDSGKTVFVVAIETIEELEKILKCELRILSTLPDGILTGATYRHPIYKDKILRFIAGTHVNSLKGTGLVHTAPAHGPEDFLVALNENIPIVNLVDDEGCYKEDVGAELNGKFVLCEGNERVIQLLNENVVHLNKITHSYPYDWRSKKPVIIRASEQWFLNTDSVKQKAIEILDGVKFLPASKGAIYKEEFSKQIKKRPFWCISRQRKWGVPIPVFYEKDTNKILLNEDIIKHQIKLVEEYGTDYWWSLSEEKLLPEKSIDYTKYKKGQDIFDIWFDSGITWSNVLGKDTVADLYLEGGDQLNGWFYSSLITSLASRDKSPYKSIYVHGFAVDSKGLKMSKSTGNVINPRDIVASPKKPYGIDVLRWWVACHANQEPLVHVSDTVLQSCSEQVQKIRSVLRFILGSLNEHNYEYMPDDSKLLLIDRYILHLLYDFQQKAKYDSEKYAFNRIGKSVINFLTNEISALYYPSIKDRLYCDSPNEPFRTSALFVLLQILETISTSIAPILPHLVEEIYTYIPFKKENSYFKSSHATVEETWKNEDVTQIMQVILDIRKNVNLQVGSSCNKMDVSIIFSARIFEKIQKLACNEDLSYDLAQILQCAEVVVTCKESQNEDYQLILATSKKFSCPRCRRTVSSVENELCGRCTNVLNCVCHKESVQI